MSGGEDPDEEFEDIDVQDDIEVRTETAVSYEEFPANLFKGGATRQGDFRIDFYSEYVSEPRGRKLDIDETGTIGQVSEFGEFELIQKKQATAVVSQENAMNLANWIIAFILDLDQDEVREGIVEQFGTEEDEDADKDIS